MYHIIYILIAIMALCVSCTSTDGDIIATLDHAESVMEEHPDSLLWQLAGSLEGVDGRTPFDAAAQGDAAAGKVIDEYVNYLGCGVASLVNIFQPEVFCIGGGPSAQGETLMAPVRYILNRED